MLSHRLHECTFPGCRDYSVRRHCERHQTPAERALRTDLDRALVDYVAAEVNYLAAVSADDPGAVVEALAPFYLADQHVRVVEAELGMVR